MHRERHDTPLAGSSPPWRAPALARSVLRLSPGERWFPDEIGAIDARVDEALLPARTLTVEVTRRRAGRGAIVSRSFACLPAYACYRDLCWWLRTLPGYDADVEERVIEWSAATAERIVDAMQAVD
jgi:hypothetical protein